MRHFNIACGNKPNKDIERSKGAKLICIFVSAKCTNHHLFVGHVFVLL